MLCCAMLCYVVGLAECMTKGETGDNSEKKGMNNERSERNREKMATTPPAGQRMVLNHTSSTWLEYL